MADLFKLRENPDKLEQFLRSIFPDLTEYSVSHKKDDVIVSFILENKKRTIYLFDEDLQLSELNNDDFVIDQIKKNI